MVYFVIYLLTTFLFTFIDCTRLENYGSFMLEITEMLSCQGPKRINCAVHTLSIENRHTMCFNATILEDFKPDNAKVSFNQKGQPSMQLQMSKPCDNFVMKGILTSLYDMNEKCIIKKGFYTAKLNIEELMKNYHKMGYIYGNYLLTSKIFNKRCNLSCLHMSMILKPK